MTLGRMSLKSHPFIYPKLSDTIPSLLEPCSEILVTGVPKITLGYSI